ncbi:hypothetical protein GCM10009716_05090 [Streptomyces sodiiphilus]|uniref:Uncharacterized protein n=1 Tax=Streptomyces sodiiphilus TaxID=226217 RepID=A0ABN2NSB8_9ACTN
MERDGQLELYGLVAARLKAAHEQVRALPLPAPQRQALVRKLLVITAAAKQDLPAAARRLDGLMRDVEEGRFPPGEPGSPGGGTP